MKDCINDFVSKFKEINEPLRVISHLDADGLTSAAILINALKRNKNIFSLTIVRQLDESRIKEFSLENYNCYLFVDLGSGFLSLIKKYLGDRKVFILDHHIPEDVNNGFFHVNPHLFGLDSGSVSGAGLAYLFAKELNEDNMDLAYIAVIGGVGDYVDFNHGFNQILLDDAVNSGELEIRKGLRIFGSQTRYLHRLLQYSTDPYIPGVTGSEEGSINFLNELGIAYKNEKGNFRKLSDLTEDELRELITGVILKRFGSEDKPEDVLGDIYLVKREVEDSPMRDAREYSTLLNACGRLRKPSLGIGTFMNNSVLKEKANELLKNYRVEIINMLNWFYKNKTHFVKDEKFVIINAEDNIKDSMIGTLCGIVLNSNIYGRNVVIVGMAYTIEGDIKVSMRTNNPKIDLRGIIKGIANGGGHSNSCGAFMKKEDEKSFIEDLRNVLTKSL